MILVISHAVYWPYNQRKIKLLTELFVSRDKIFSVNIFIPTLVSAQDQIQVKGLPEGI